MEKEYIVGLHKDVDYDQFWQEMESSTNGKTYIPDRAVDIVNNRDLSTRCCHYALSDAEAEILRQDPRVATVSLPAPPEVRGHNLIQTGNFSRNNGGNTNTWVNWGLRRCVLESPELSIGNQYPYCIDGTGVDIVIQDNGVMSGHPEWLGPDNKTRFVEHDWYQAAGVAGTMPVGHYGDVGNHGTHVAGIAAGRTYGWAKGATIYSIRYDAFNNDSDAFDLVKAWHLRKPIDPKTGYRRPTILNASWGYRWYYNNAGLGGSLTTLYYRGTNRGTTGTQYGNVNNTHNFTYTPADIDQQELTDAGVICVRAAGNYYHKIDVPAGSDWDNYYTWSTSWANIVPIGQPIYYHRGGSPWSLDTILVANCDSQLNGGTLEQVRQDSERGPGVHIAAPGDDITSSTNSSGFGIGADSTYPFDPSYKISRISGTSMASPQVTGMLALFLQMNPGATAQQCKNWLNNFGSKDNKMYSTGLDDDYSNSRSLQGQQNKFLYWPYGKDIGFNNSGGIRRK